jgi:hypothetical protein
MAFDPWTAALETAGKIIDKIWPDKTKAEEMKFEVFKLQQAGALQQEQNDFNLSLEQVKVNAVEAASASKFVAGWRPFIGWVCGFSLAYNYIFFPLYTYTIKLFIINAPSMPILDNGELITLLMALLGLGAMRSFDKGKQLASPDSTNPVPIKPGA